ncbi:helix-turn-helix domain-containing protein [Agathobaculum sp.]|uniref:helix-turn-helix domain-containing protein n=1 Tax=Agathobaculum sp. TaxID=2048138 RepID=UPI002A7EA6A7|nr:AraC family transcriptional regulator [Agathobaculum sp.]MDY3619130.1 AraC family transcriptional regulator [Agathobaculum sp.]
MTLYPPPSFQDGLTPSLLYATRQTVSSQKVHRSIHRHDGIVELLFVYQGEGTYIVDGYSYSIRPGDLLLYNQGDLHEVSSASEHEIGTFCFGISGLSLNGLTPGQMTTPENGFVRPAGARHAEIHALCKLIYEHMEQNTAHAHEIANRLLPALVLLSLDFPADERSGQQQADLILSNRIRQYIAVHFAEPLTLAGLGSLLHVSPYYLAHVFKRITGFSPIQYMIRCRIGEAQNLLITTDYSAAQIAAMVGYNGAGHFNAIFTKTVGLPPIRYRREYLARMQGRRGQ